MTIHPILFSGPMVRANLDGLKTQTRRVLDLPKKTHSGGRIYEHPKMGGWEPTTFGGGGAFRFGKNGERIPEPERVAIWHRTCGVCLIVPFQPGDMLWVRETLRYDWTANAWQYDADKTSLEATRNFTLETPTPERWSLGFCPSIHMPRWASRLTDKVTGVKVERLQAISEDDARAEGCIKLKASGRAVEYPGAQYLGQAWPNCRSWYRHLWDSINGKKPGHAWADNPWVVAVTFETIRQNVMEIANAD